MSNDLRIDILDEHGLYLHLSERALLDKALIAMDAHFERRSMELLDFIIANVDQIFDDETSNNPFYYKGEWITKEALFQNFL